jgi:dTDP-D-glucose 4,6-dehydratase
MIDFHSFRAGHDMHYGLDGLKMRNMGWVAPCDLEQSLSKTVRWMRDNPKWLC